MTGMTEPAELVQRALLNLPTAYQAAVPGSREEAIAHAFSTALRVDRVGVLDDFFDLGGDSLAAEELSLLVGESLGTSFPASVLAEHSTPRDLAAFLHAEGRTECAPYTAPAVFAVHGQQGYMMPAPDFFGGVGEGQRFHFFELPGLRDDSAPLETISELADSYLAEVRARVPAGPVRLAAFCLGSVIAVQMARRLLDAGTPHRLVLVEPSLGAVPAKIYLKGQWAHPGRVRALDDADKRREAARRIADSAERKQLAGRDPLGLRYPGQHFSVEARARFQAAANYNNPPRYEQQVVILCSDERRKSYETHPSLWDEIIPHRRTAVVGDTHDEVLRSPTGRTARTLLDAFEGKFDR